jgi:hypothetical protein
MGVVVVLEIGDALLQITSSSCLRKGAQAYKPEYLIERKHEVREGMEIAHINPHVLEPIWVPPLQVAPQLVVLSVPTDPPYKSWAQAALEVLP